MRSDAGDPPSLEEKRQALDLVLPSKTFARAEQLRSLLQYLGKTDEGGRNRELSECGMGREVLGRPPEFSPGEDPSVRTRACELRHKLEKFSSATAMPGGFANRSFPFPVPDDTDGLWNSLFIKNATTVTAISHTTLDGIRGCGRSTDAQFIGRLIREFQTAVRNLDGGLRGEPAA